MLWAQNCQTILLSIAEWMKRDQPLCVYVYWPSNPSVCSQSQSCKQLLWQNEGNFVNGFLAKSQRPFQVTQLKHNIERSNADLIHAVEKRPVRLPVAETLAKVHQVNPTELHPFEGRDELLNTLHHVSHRHWRGDTTAALAVLRWLLVKMTSQLTCFHTCMQLQNWNLQLTPVTAGRW